MSDTRVQVALGDRGYDIVVGGGLLERVGQFLGPVLREKRVLVVTDAHVAAAQWPRLERALRDLSIEAPLVVLPAGEGSKELGELGRLLDSLLDHRPERSSTLLALGGGVIGDITGLAASLLLRGVNFVQVPTTLLAQVDSAIGGKTGINTRHGKNLVGTFHQPRLVLADLDTLDSLPRRELLAGYAEIVKYALIDDAPFFDWLEAHGPAVIAGDRAARAHAVETSCRAKARTVAADEREAGARALLNLGHTFGHALEAASGYGADLLHGEAVAIGLVLAFDLSARLGLCAPDDARRIEHHLRAVGLPTAVPARGWSAERLLALMAQDKKVRDGKLTFVLARAIGRAFVAHDVDVAAVRDLLERVVA